MQPNTEKTKKWHVVYTRSRAEKKVRDELSEKNIECFLPLQKKLRKWSDRKKWIETPLITGYCFVRIKRDEYDRVLETNNVVSYITFEGRAAIIPDKQIHYLKQLLTKYDFDVEVTTENFEPGKKVEVIAGPLIGLRGELTESRGKHKFMLRFTQINAIFSVEVNASDISLLPEEV